MYVQYVCVATTLEVRALRLEASGSATLVANLGPVFLLFDLRACESAGCVCVCVCVCVGVS
jgi:hypothetical protein